MRFSLQKEAMQWQWDFLSSVSEGKLKLGGHTDGLTKFNFFVSWTHVSRSRSHSNTVRLRYCFFIFVLISFVLMLLQSDTGSNFYSFSHGAHSLLIRLIRFIISQFKQPRFLCLLSISFIQVHFCLSDHWKLLLIANEQNCWSFFGYFSLNFDSSIWCWIHFWRSGCYCRRRRLPCTSVVQGYHTYRHYVWSSLILMCPIHVHQTHFPLLFNVCFDVLSAYFMLFQTTKVPQDYFPFNQRDILCLLI